MPDLADAANEAPKQWPVTVTLKHPFEYNGNQVATLVFRKGKLGDLKGFDLTEVPTVNETTLLASRLCGVPVAALEMLDEEDIAEVLAVPMGFFGRSLQTGAGR